MNKEKDKGQSAFEAYDDFTNYRRPSDCTIQNYIVEFNFKYNKIKTHDMPLPECVLEYYLLKCANLTEEQTNLCKATSTQLDYKTMHIQIEKVSSNINSDEQKAASRKH